VVAVEQRAIDRTADFAVGGFHERQPDGAHFVAVTDPGTSLAKLGAEHGFRRVFENDNEIGGRYSALSYFGLVPAALMGVDIHAVLEAAAVAVSNCQLKEGNSGLWLGIALGELARNGRDKLTFVVDGPLTAFGLWAEQLVAESTGKLGRGILPIADEPLVDPGAYGPDRVFVHIASGDSANAAHIQAVRKADTRDPVLMLDEIDKLGQGFHGDPSAALLEVLDPEQNATFRDNYLAVPFDLSRVMFVGTANVLDQIPGPLRDPLEVIELPGYTEDEKVEIAKRYLLPRQLSATGLAPEQGEIEDDAIRAIIRD